MYLLPAQVSSLREELAVRCNELSHSSTALEEHKQQLGDVRAQLGALQQQSTSQLDAAQKLLLQATHNAAVQLRQVQESLTYQIKQLQSELAQARTDKQQLKMAKAQQQQEGRLVVDCGCCLLTSSQLQGHCCRFTQVVWHVVSCLHSGLETCSALQRINALWEPGAIRYKLYCYYPDFLLLPLVGT